MLTPTESWRKNQPDLAWLTEASAGIQAYVRRNRDPVIRLPLTYTGELLSATDSKTRIKNKNAIRWCFADQLMQALLYGDFSRLPQEEDKSLVPGQARNFKGVDFVPLVAKSPLVTCGLAIRIERRERPGMLINDGDLDNRLKTIFDALRLPQNENEVVLLTDDLQRKNCVCLLEDDSMIEAISIKAISSFTELPRNHVRLTIDVEIKAHDLVFYPE